MSWRTWTRRKLDWHTFKIIQILELCPYSFLLRSNRIWASDGQEFNNHHSILAHQKLRCESERRRVPIAQRIERGFAEPEIGVRFLVGTQNEKINKPDYYFIFYNRFSVANAVLFFESILFQQSSAKNWVIAANPI